MLFDLSNIYIIDYVILTIMLAMLDVCNFPEQFGLKVLHLLLPLLACQHGVSSLLQNGSQHV